MLHSKPQGKPEKGADEDSWEILCKMRAVVSFLFRGSDSTEGGFLNFGVSTNQAVVAVVLLFVAALHSQSMSAHRISQSRKQRRHAHAVEEYLAQIESLGIQISLHTRANFLVQPCTRCHENLMSLVQVSPNARSVKCRCDNCGKGYWAEAGNRDALVLKDFVSDLENLKERYIHLTKIDPGGTDGKGSGSLPPHRRPGGVLVNKREA